jgi:hypothetical protein
VVRGDGRDARRSRGGVVLESFFAYSVYDADAQRGVWCGTEGFGRIAYQRPGQEYRYFGEEEKAVEGFEGLDGPTCMLGGGSSGGCACGLIWLQGENVRWKSVGGRVKCGGVF